MAGSDQTARVYDLAAYRPTPAPSIDDLLEIGARLESVRHELIDAGTQMSVLLDNPAADLTREVVQMLERQTCKIAVVGQIKAGKSSFVNALIRRPGLLPTDINPWTTAVTSLHFCQAAPDGAEAVFTFFGDDEWEQLAQGGGKLRELTERLVPGFVTAHLRQQVMGLKARATQRLGEQYAQLAGRTHSYPRLTGEMLSQYVCSGNPDPLSSEGRYSDITRSADLYPGAGPFAFPMTVIDTPGTNDPFLVRDEITRASLDRADIALVLLSAHQPLSDADVSLLRVLRGLSKERIIVVINRIDELADAARDTPEIVEYVRRKLRNEFPGSDIPIVAGSALWGLAAHAATTAELEQATLQRALAYCRDANLIDHNAFLTGAPSGEIIHALHRHALISASGLPKLHAALDQLLPQTRGGYLVHQFGRSFRDMAETSLMTIRDARDSIVRVHNETRAASGEAQAKRERLNDEAATLTETIALVKRMASDFEGQLTEVMARGLTRLDTRLQAQVDHHAANERHALALRLRINQSMRSWTADSAALNRELSDEFLFAFGETEQQLRDVSAAMIDGLRELAGLIGNVPGAQNEPSLGRKLVAPPNLGALGRALVLDLDEMWWGTLWKARPDPEERGEAIESLVRGVYYPIIDELKVSFERALRGYIDTTTRWSHAVCSTIARALANRQEQLAQRATLSGIGPEDRAERTQPPNEQQLQSLDRKIAQAESVLQRLRVLFMKIDGLFA